MQRLNHELYISYSCSKDIPLTTHKLVKHVEPLSLNGYGSIVQLDTWIKMTKNNYGIYYTDNIWQNEMDIYHIVNAAL